MLKPNENGVSNALTTVQKDNLLDDGYRIRKLTPLEVWRLQDFPDEAHEKAKAAGVSDSQRYKQSGNSMTVAVVEMIFRQIGKALSKQANSTSLLEPQRGKLISKPSRSFCYFARNAGV